MFIYINIYKIKLLGQILVRWFILFSYSFTYIYEPSQLSYIIYELFTINYYY